MDIATIGLYLYFLVRNLRYNSAIAHCIVECDKLYFNLR